MTHKSTELKPVTYWLSDVRTYSVVARHWQAHHVLVTSLSPWHLARGRQGILAVVRFRLSSPLPDWLTVLGASLGHFGPRGILYSEDSGEFVGDELIRNRLKNRRKQIIVYIWTFSTFSKFRQLKHFIFKIKMHVRCNNRWQAGAGVGWWGEMGGWGGGGWGVVIFDSINLLLSWMWNDGFLSLFVDHKNINLDIV